MIVLYLAATAISILHDRRIAKRADKLSNSVEV